MARPRHWIALSLGVCALQFPLVSSAQDRAAADLYVVRCAMCHGNSGEGTNHVNPRLGPALKGNPFVANGSPAAIANVIRKGRSGKKRIYDDTYPNMPAFGPGPVPDAERLAAFLKADLQK